MNTQPRPELGRRERPPVEPVEQPEPWRPEEPERRRVEPGIETEAGPTAAPPAARPAGPEVPKLPPVTSPLTREIETILAEGLEEVYRSLPAASQRAFRAEGERVASTLSALIESLKVKAKQVLTLIRNWLKLIPGINRFFLEQEAKIKTDRILELARRQGVKKLQALFQLGLPSGGVGLPTSASDLADRLAGQTGLTVLLTLLLALVGVVLVLFLLRWLVRRLARVPPSLHYVVLRLTVPKEVTPPGQPTPDPKALLAQAETLFLNLGGLRPGQRGGRLRDAWETFWFGSSSHLAFEIVAHHGLISFYAAVPRHLQRLTELQIHAQYPRASIEEIEDYNIFRPHGSIVGVSLGLTKHQMFPIRTYRKLDSDPLNAVTNAISKLQEHDGAAIQLLIRPAGSGWRAAGQRLAWHLQKGKSFNEAMAAITGGGLGSTLGKVVRSLASSFRRPSERTDENLPPVLTPMQQELVRALEEKASKHGFEANLRVIVSSATLPAARSTLANIVNAFSQYTAQESGIAFRQRLVWFPAQLIHDFIYRRFNERGRFILNSEEVVSLYHLPLPTTETPNILWLTARQAPAPVNLPTEGLILGQNVYRGVETLVRMKPDDRRRHVYIIGTTGSGKSVLMEEMAKQDIRNGEGVCIVDPHGSLVESVLASIPKERAEDVILFDPSNTERPIGLNMLEAGSPEQRDFAVQEMIAIFYKLFPPEMIGPMFEHNMRNAMLTLMEDEEYPGTIADIPRIFTDKAFQQYKVRRVRDPIVRAFWEKEMAKTSDFHKSEMLGYLISKVGRFVENAMMRNIIGQPQSGFNFREVMDQRKILLVNLSKGQVGEVNAALLGLIVVSKLQMVALSRANLPESQRPDFYLYLDEFQNFITDSIATILSEARKYKLNLTLAHQYMGQLQAGQDTRVRDAVLGNVGTMIAFRIGIEDAEILAKQFAPVFDAFDLVNQGRFNAYVKLLIDNSAAKSFSLRTFPPSPGNPAVGRALRQLSQLKYGRERQAVEAEILIRTKLGEAEATLPPLTERRG